MQKAVTKLKLRRKVMAKKSMIAREKKRQKLVKKYKLKRDEYKSKMKTAVSFQEKLDYQNELQKLPTNSSPTRLHNRCALTGRPKGYLRFFGLSRHVFREMAHEGFLPGVTKSSW
jgi:small subunit ribosomal protein S14